MMTIPRVLWRAMWAQLHPRMLALSVLPFVLCGVIWGAVFYFAWEPMMQTIQSALGGNGWLTGWLHLGAERWGWQWSETAAVVILAVLLLPAIVLSVLICVGVLAGPLAVAHVARSYPTLARRGRGMWWRSLVNAGLAALLFALMWVVTWPLWLIPGVALVLPVVLWGWLNYRVMAFDALALHATPEELALLMRRRRLNLWALGMVVALLGSLPTLVWVGGALVFVLAPLLALVVLWLYVLVFTFSALAFAHDGLAALANLRAGVPPHEVIA